MPLASVCVTRPTGSGSPVICTVAPGTGWPSAVKTPPDAVPVSAAAAAVQSASRRTMVVKIGRFEGRIPGGAWYTASRIVAVHSQVPAVRAIDATIPTADASMSKTVPDPAASQLFPLVYGELRKVARNYLGRERAEHTLQP